MATESPCHPQPDDLPENERTGNEPNPSGKTPRKADAPEKPQRQDPAVRI